MKKNNPKKVLVYKNSDGFITEDKKQYTEREKRLKRMAVLEKQGKEDEFCGEYWSLSIEMWYWNKSKAKRDHQDAMEKQIVEDKKNACQSCYGSGEHDESDYCGNYKVGCSECSGTGLKESYRKKTGRNEFCENTWYPAR